MLTKIFLLKKCQTSGAISMCENLLQYRIDRRLRSVAETIIQEQSKGVKELMEVRKNLRKY